MSSAPRKINPQIKIMGILTLVFFGGIVAYTLLPEGPVRGIGMAIVCFLSLYSMFKSV